MVLRQVAFMTLAGGAIGLTGAIWIGSVTENQLYEMQGRDPYVLAASGVVLTLVALGAGWFPRIAPPGSTR